MQEALHNKKVSIIMKRTLQLLVLELSVFYSQLQIKRNTTFNKWTLRRRYSKGLKYDSNLVCKLNRSLYVLKQAPHMWNERFNNYILKLKFERSKNDYCLYVRKTNNNVVYLLVYVDDLLLIGNSIDEIEIVKSLLKEEFEMKNLGNIDVYLGVKVVRNIENCEMKIHQKSFILNLLKRFGMENSNCCDTPMEPKLYLTKDSNEELTKKPYKELIGCLMYLMLTSRPDLSVSVNYLSRFQNCATESHWNHLKRVLRYLKKSINMVLMYDGKSDEILVAYSDSDWGNDVDDRKSTSGYIIKLYGCTISWLSKKQPTVSLSSTEAEYIDLCVTTCEIIAVKKLLQDLNIKLESPISIYEDNMSCIKIAEEPKEHQRMKHIDIKYNFVRDLVQENVINILYKPTKEQVADFFTKSLSKIPFEQFRYNVGII